MSGIEALKSLFSKRFDCDEPQRDYVTVDSSGHATFDVASYLMSVEGHRKVLEIAEATRDEVVAQGKESVK